jgi:serine/threonine protein kinase
MDFKPENVLISVNKDGSLSICLADFGLAEILPKGTYYAKTKHEKITSWFRCPRNSLSKANDEMFHISWIADFYAWCVSILYMMSLRMSPTMSPYAPPSGKQFDFVKSYLFDIFRTQAYLTSNDPSDENPKEIDIRHSTDEINRACQIIKSPFLRNLLMEYMNPETILRWYSELEISPKNNSIIPKVIAKMETYFRMTKVVAELNARLKCIESDTETPPRPHTTGCP